MKATPIILGMGLSLLGCATHRGALCSAEGVKGVEVGFVPASAWFSLLLHGYDPAAGANPRPTVDCTGTPVVWQEPAADECLEPGPPAEPLPPPEKLADGDVVLSSAGTNQQLVWIITRRFANGEGQGPLALIERSGRSLTARALGPLRSLTVRPKLRLERAGGIELLVAEGDACVGDTCRRELRVVPLRDARFLPEPVGSESGGCLGPAWFPLRREEEYELPTGTRRKLALTSVLSFGPAGVDVHELVEVREYEPALAASPPILSRRIQADRTVRVGAARLVSTGPSLWAQLTRELVAAGARRVEPLAKAPAPASPVQARREAALTAP